MKHPRFSIVIPTRNRPDTLRWSLKTCMQRGYEDYEVIVFDNCSDTTAAPLVQERGDPRFKFHRSERPLAMSDSWEEALKRSSGDYVTVLGDDDGLLPCALVVADSLLKRFPTDVLNWSPAVYDWPGMLKEDLHFEMLDKIHRVRTTHLVRSALSFRLEWGQLPMIYSSFYSRRLIDLVVGKAGRFFLANSPDSASAFAMCAVLDDFYALRYPLGVRGASPSSTGALNFTNTEGSDARVREFWTLSRKAGFDLHAGVPARLFCPIQAAVADSYLRCRDALGGNLARHSFRRDRFFSSAVEQIHRTFSEEGEFAKAIALVKEDMKPGDRAGVDLAVRRWRASHPATPPPRSSFGPEPERFRLWIRPQDFGITNVLDACEFVTRMTGLPDNAALTQARLCRYRDSWAGRVRRAAGALLGRAYYEGLLPM